MANSSKDLEVPGSSLPPTSYCSWRCSHCNRLLGICRDGRMHLRLARGHEYLVGYPVQATCRSCGTMNQRLGCRCAHKTTTD